MESNDHYIDVIMTTVASQITSLTIVYSIVYSGEDQRKHQSSASLSFVRGIHRDRWIPRTKGQLRGKCFHLMTSSCDNNTKKHLTIILETRGIYAYFRDEWIKCNILEIISVLCLIFAFKTHACLKAYATFSRWVVTRAEYFRSIVHIHLSVYCRD